MAANAPEQPLDTNAEAPAAGEPAAASVVESPPPASSPAGRLLSVNVGLPKDVPWQGRTVCTGIFKEPVKGPCRAAKLNLDGDGQGDLAGHGGEQRAVFVYQLDSYRHWERELDRKGLAYGQFGENLTIEGLSDNEVCIGDRFRIGSATFEVTQPRVTCYRVGIRMEDPRMPALLVSHHRPGFYFRVIEEGEVEAGDDIVKLAEGPEQMTVAEVSGLLYLPGHPRQQLLRALRIEALSPGWQGSFRAMLATDGSAGNAGLTATAPPPAWAGFRRLAVTDIAEASGSVRAITLRDPAGEPLPLALPGQYLTLRVAPDPNERALLRNYSLCGPVGPDAYRIAVKREPEGAASGYLHNQLEVGQELEIGAPRGSFILDQSEAPLLLISAGVGVTPVLAILEQLSAERSPRQLWWLHSARNGREHAFAAEARTLLGALAGARSRIYYSHPDAGDRAGRDYDEAGRLSAGALLELEPPRDGEAFICGPPAFMDEISAGLTSIGVEPARIHTEPFGPERASTPGIAQAPLRAPHQPAGSPGTGPLVEFARSNLSVPWSSDFASLLELAEACAVPVRWSCRTGVCHTCESPLIEGNVDYDPEPVEPPADGSLLICCARPESALVLDL